MQPLGPILVLLCLTVNQMLVSRIGIITHELKNQVIQKGFIFLSLLQTLTNRLCLDMKVMLFHNEHLVEEQPACGESVCSLTSFWEYYQHLLELDLREEYATTFSAGTEANKDVDEHEEYETDISEEDDDSSQEDSDEDSSEESIEEDN